MIIRKARKVITIGKCILENMPVELEPHNVNYLLGIGFKYDDKNGIYTMSSGKIKIVYKLVGMYVKGE